jgi:tagatose 1,6-diphosphate aldolase
VIDRAAVRQTRLARWFGPDGLIAGIAIDHRDALLEAWQRITERRPERSAVEAFKARAVRTVGPHATVVLLDAEFGGPALRERVVPLDVALVMPLEAQGYQSVGDGRLTTLLPDFGAAEAARLGAVGCKLLLPYHPDDVGSAAFQDEVARGAITESHETDMPLVVEPIVYRFEAESPASFDARLAERVSTTAAHLAKLAPDVLKLQFPAGTPDDDVACAAVTRACGGIPWVLLGAGSDAETFAAQLKTAVRAGAAGFIVGRTVWEGALALDEAASNAYLGQEAVPMFRHFAEIARAALPV